MFKLPELPYPYDALEPHIDVRTLQIHHDKRSQLHDLKGVLQDPGQIVCASSKLVQIKLPSKKVVIFGIRYQMVLRRPYPVRKFVPIVRIAIMVDANDVDIVFAGFIKHPQNITADLGKSGGAGRGVAQRQNLNFFVHNYFQLNPLPKCPNLAVSANFTFPNLRKS